MQIGPERCGCRLTYPQGVGGGFTEARAAQGGNPPEKIDAGPLTREEAGLP